MHTDIEVLLGLKYNELEVMPDTALIPNSYFPKFQSRNPVPLGCEFPFIFHNTKLYVVYKTNGIFLTKDGLEIFNKIENGEIELSKNINYKLLKEIGFSVLDTNPLFPIDDCCSFIYGGILYITKIGNKLKSSTQP